MWWKLTILMLVTTGLIFLVIPIRTHAVLVDPANPPSHTKRTFSSVVSNMYLTPGTIAMICAALVIAAYIAFRIIRSS